MNNFNICVIDQNKQNNIINQLKSDLNEVDIDINEISYDNLKKFNKQIIVIPIKSIIADFDYIDINMIMYFNKEIIIYQPDNNIIGYKKPNNMLCVYTNDKTLSNNKNICNAFNKYVNDIEETKKYLSNKNIPLTINLFDYLS